MSTQPKVVLVTGCSNGGIGFGLCKEYAARGCKVYATARRLAAMDAFKHENVEKLVLDVTDEKNVQEAVSTIIEREGRIDVLVNNAGVLCVGPVIEVPMETIERTYDTNVFSIIRMCKAVIPHMAARKSGTIVNISSVTAYYATPWSGIYGSTKAATHSLSDVLYMECTPLNISVVLVATGAVRSNLAVNHAAAFAGLPKTSLYKRFLPDMLARVELSQGADSMPTKDYAKQVADKTLRKSPPRYMLLGGKTWMYAMLKWLPRSFVLWLFWRMFSKLGRAV